RSRDRRESAPLTVFLAERSSGQELAGDDEPQDLARAFADGRELHVAEEFLGRIILHETVAPMDLDAVVGGPHGDLAGVQLRHRRFESGAAPAVLEICGAVGQEARRLDARGVVSELPLNGLKPADRPAERLAVLRISERCLMRALRQTDGERSDADAAGVEDLHRMDEAFTLGAE